MSYQILASFATMLHHTITAKLDDSNWFIWSKKMISALCTIDMSAIVMGSAAYLSKSKRKEWNMSDGKLSEYIFGLVSDEYQYLVEDTETGSAAWTALKGHFKKSTIGYHMSACKELYNIKHDAFCPISAYIQSLQSA
ncbi:hypothetical protein H0H87_005253 [Tephrocybe sp. NHM501043]|nr:hypothetical protein H0H87_005253 [Tephrocybe sp. NHM501043]